MRSMARASSRTQSYEAQSPTTGETRTIIERSFVRSDRVGGRYITASKQFALFDTQGRRYERQSSVVITCVQTGETFHILGSAERIRKTE